eukprot:augustus_masked-scaffold_2-processed-gene-13.52-mRNA-1 protein AED:1.00 eAED:1.00 QI:0/-1/0/0/-1/1/1/0/493
MKEIFSVALNGNLQRLKDILADEKPNLLTLYDENGLNLSHIAASTAQLSVIEYLFNLEPKLFSTHYQKSNAKKKFQFIRFRREHILVLDGMITVHFLCFAGSIDCLEFILKHETLTQQLFTFSQDFTNCLHFVSINDNFVFLEEIIKRKRNEVFSLLNRQNIEEFIARDISVIFESVKCFEILLNLEEKKFSLQEAVDLFDLLINSDRLDVKKHLKKTDKLKAGLIQVFFKKLEADDSQILKNLLYHVYDSHFKGTVQRLRESGVQIAARKGYLLCVKILVQYGADPFVKQNFGHNCVGLAQVGITADIPKEHQSRYQLIMDYLQNLKEKISREQEKLLLDLTEKPKKRKKKRTKKKKNASQTGLPEESKLASPCVSYADKLKNDSNGKQESLDVLRSCSEIKESIFDESESVTELDPSLVSEFPLLKELDLNMDNFLGHDLYDLSVSQLETLRDTWSALSERAGKLVQERERFHTLWGTWDSVIGLNRRYKR